MLFQAGVVSGSYQDDMPYWRPITEMRILLLLVFIIDFILNLALYQEKRSNTSPSAQAFAGAGRSKTRLPGAA